MEKERGDISPKTAAAIALVFILIGIGLCVLGSYALVQAWTWDFPLVLLMFLGLAAFLVAWVIILFYLFICVMELRGLKPEDIFKDTEDAKH